jgi:hypothetical protein
MCVEASCVASTACGEGLECSDYAISPGCPGQAFACQTPADACAVDADCPGGERCALQGDRRACTGAACSVGRPFLVDGAARLAGVADRSDWLEDMPSPCTAALSPAARARAAAYWTEIGRMEHASIAAFARFVLELLGLGAPPGLLRAAQEAMADETIHAQMAFALASAYLGTGVGPGPLSLDHVRTAADGRSFFGVVVREGCIGETMAAVEAEEALASTKDPVVRAVLARIARDETRHAELAWRTAAWALRLPGSSGWALEVPAALAEARLDADRVVQTGPDLVDHGVIDEPRRKCARRAALDRVIEPCVRALLGDLSMGASSTLGPQTCSTRACPGRVSTCRPSIR